MFASRQVPWPDDDQPQWGAAGDAGCAEDTFADGEDVETWHFAALAVPGVRSTRGFFSPAICCWDHTFTQATSAECTVQGATSLDS